MIAGNQLVAYHFLLSFFWVCSAFLEISTFFSKTIKTSRKTELETINNRNRDPQSSLVKSSRPNLVSHGSHCSFCPARRELPFMLALICVLLFFFFLIICISFLYSLDMNAPGGWGRPNKRLFLPIRGLLHLSYHYLYSTASCLLPNTGIMVIFSKHVHLLVGYLQQGLEEVP